MKNDMRPIDWIALVLLFVLTIVAVVVVHNAGAEALPSPDAKTLLALDGDLKLSDAPLDIHVAECLRVDIVSGGEDGTWADLTLPKVPPGIVGVALFDGWHLIYGVWEQTGETTLRLRFWPEDVARLDGTVGIYLVILAEGE
ncbi:MAG: hypothetical protein IKH57_21195 [Clostridia bacterium]|nr:hypothetical protein [Clostridia bacterium]